MVKKSYLRVTFITIMLLFVSPHIKNKIANGSKYIDIRIWLEEKEFKVRLSKYINTRLFN